MDELIKEMQQFGDLTSSFTSLDVLVVFSLSLALCLTVGWIYRTTRKNLIPPPNWYMLG